MVPPAPGRLSTTIDCPSASPSAGVKTRVATSTPLPGAEFNLRRNLDHLERGLVLRAIASTKGKKREACDLLGIDARNLGYYVRKHKISEDELKTASTG